MLKTLLTIFVVSIALSGLIVHSAQAQNINQFTQTLTDLNRSKPLQNPKWERSADVLKSRILDRKNKVVGDLQDITLANEGNIQALKVELNRLQLGSDVYLNYQNLNIRSASRAFIMGYDDDEIEAFYPELLANIETAAGTEGDTISVKNLINSDVESEDGRRLGKVQEVMFDNQGNRAEALLIRVRYKTVSGESIAIPFSSASYRPDGNRYNVFLTNDQADEVLAIAKSR